MVRLVMLAVVLLIVLPVFVWLPTVEGVPA